MGREVRRGPGEARVGGAGETTVGHGWGKGGARVHLSVRHGKWKVATPCGAFCPRHQSAAGCDVS